MKSKSFILLALVTTFALLLSACVAPAGTAPAAAPAAAEPATGAEAAATDSTDLTQPSILSNVKLRQGIAHCIDRDSLIAAVYPYVAEDVKPTLRMDSPVPKSHWSYTGPFTDYPYDVEAGKALLEEAGWAASEESPYRTNAEGDTLELTLTTTNSSFRQTWAAVVETNLADCGILLIRQHTPAAWWFGDTTGLARRDFQLGAFAWVGQAEPGGRTLYACDQIPTPGNNWEGQNGMGWCNETASNAIVAAGNSLDRAERIKSYDTFNKEFANDMVSLPLFQRAEAEAHGNNLEGLKSDPTEYGSASAAAWKLTDGGDTIVVGFSQEPASMFSLVESAAVQRQVAQMGVALGNTQYSYDYQAVMQDGLSTLDSGLATNELVDVVAGDTVYAADGNPAVLEAGTKVVLNGETIEWDGSSALQLPQLVVTYKFKPYTWSDGTAGSIEDFKLAIQINCDRTSGATEFNTCDQFGSEADTLANVVFSDSALEYTITYWPGVQDPTYHVAPFTISSQAVYPSHQVLSDGRSLVDVPAAEWATLPEIAELPLSMAPFMITEWVKGQSITLAANPHYAGGTGVANIIILIVQDTNQAVAQLISGDVDYLEKATLAGGAEVQTVVDAAAQGKVSVEIIPSPTWEHIDMNMFVKEK